MDVCVGMDTNPDLHRLGQRLVGRWTSEATPPMVPGTTITGSSEFEWLDGERFLIYRTHYDHPQFPDAIAILGGAEELRMHYFDARGVQRLFELTVTDEGWTILMRRESAVGSYASGDAPFPSPGEPPLAMRLPQRVNEER